jgi:hypothetical protein
MKRFLVHFNVHTPIQIVFLKALSSEMDPAEIRLIR